MRWNGTTWFAVVVHTQKGNLTLAVHFTIIGGGRDGKNDSISTGNISKTVWIEFAMTKSAIHWFHCRSSSLGDFPCHYRQYRKAHLGEYICYDTSLLHNQQQQKWCDDDDDDAWKRETRFQSNQSNWVGWVKCAWYGSCTVFYSSLLAFWCSENLLKPTRELLV